MEENKKLQEIVNESIKKVSQSTKEVKVCDVGLLLYEVTDTFMKSEKNPKIDKLLAEFEKGLKEGKINSDQIYFQTVLMLFNSLMTGLYVNFVKSKEEQAEIMKEMFDA